MKCFLVILLCGSLAVGQWRAPQVKPEALAAHVSFLASDALEGRRTPSKGLDAAAAYIASWFRRNRLEAPVDGGYFQIAKINVRRQPADGFSLVLEDGGAKVNVPASAISGSLGKAASVGGAGIYKLEMNDANAGADLTEQDIAGRALLLVPKAGVRSFGLLRKVLGWKLPAILMIDGSPFAEGFGAVRLGQRQAGLLRLHSKDAADFAARLPAGATSAKLTLRAAEPVDEQAEARNVIGIVRGSDPQLRDSYVMVSAHYDHLGSAASGTGDPVFHGANDDASGVAAMLEIAAAAAKRKPKRSLLFVAFYGEEDGLVGSRYYGRNPVVPLERMAAQLNLEQLGRTDVDGEKEIAAYNLTGFDFTTLHSSLEKSAKRYKVRLYKKEGSDAFFGRSDNQAMADVGVPSTTVSVGYEFPDYHQRSDTWDKLDYPNMARIAGSLAAGVLSIAKERQPPMWNDANEQGKKYKAIRNTGQK